MIKDVMRIRCPAMTAFDLMADPRNELQWNGGVSQVELISGEPIGKGSRFRVVDKRGQHEVEITAYQRPRKLCFFLNDKSMDVEIDITLVEEGNVTVLTGMFTPHTKGFMRLLFPILQPIIRRDIAKEHKKFIALCEAQD
jgi:Polyketide cyclase / dehydrase and lipid transport